MKNDEPFIYGETLNRAELIKRETDEFLNYINKNAYKNKNHLPLLVEFSQTRNWGKDEFAGSKAGDFRAVWNYFQQIFYGTTYLKITLETPEGKREKIQIKYERYLKKEGLSKPLSADQLRQIDYWAEKRDKILEPFFEGKGEKIKTNQDYQEFTKIAKPVFDSFFKACLMKPCKASDCLNPVGEGKRYYCSDRCKDKEKSRRHRAKHPKKDKKSKLKYLKFLEEEGDI